MGAGNLVLRSYQKAAVNLIKDKKKFGLFLFMGAGKTLITLSAIKELLQEKKIKNVLITAPLQVVKSTWPSEIQKWSEFNGLSYNIITGDVTPHKRHLLAHNKADITIVNFDMLKWLSDNKYTSWDMLVIDESSAFKSNKSERFRKVKKFSYDYLIELSGTPTPKNYLDLWSQIYLLDQGEALGKSFSAFKIKYFNPEGYRGYNWVPKDSKVIFERIKDLVCTIKPEEYLSLPEKIDVLTHVNLPVSKEYKNFAKSFILKLEADKVDMEAVATKAILINKLAQFCSGAVYITSDDSETNCLKIHDAKLDALETILENNPDENILVAYRYKSDLKRLKDKFKHAVELTDDNIILWNQGKIKMMLCQPASAGFGLNLQTGGSTIVWFSMTWNLEHYLQFNARLHRFGQSKPVVINHLIASLDCGTKTVDQLIYEALQDKSMNQEKLMESLLRSFE